MIIFPYEITGKWAQQGGWGLVVEHQADKSNICRCGWPLMPLMLGVAKLLVQQYDSFKRANFYQQTKNGRCPFEVFDPRTWDFSFMGTLFFWFVSLMISYGFDPMGFTTPNSVRRIPTSQDAQMYDIYLPAGKTLKQNPVL